MKAYLDALPPRPADPLLGITAAFRADPRPDKMDLGVGVYRDESGATPVLGAVKQAEARLVETQSTKAYEGPRGNGAFCEAVEGLVYGAGSPMLSDGRVMSMVSPGGCGAIFLALSLAARLSHEGRVFVSDPSWPNHVNVAQAAGREAVAYPYLDIVEGKVAFSHMMDALREARAGDIVIFQGPCHNPSGVDLEQEQWAYLGDFCARQHLIPLVDIAYHGFGDGLEADMAGVRAFLAQAPAAMMAYSCSKNFGLYRERTGSFLLQAGSAAGAQSAATHVAEVARAVYSMPPAHGAAIVETILSDEDLTPMWQGELEHMRTRMVSLRGALADALNEAVGTHFFDVLKTQKGMFSMLPLQGPVTDIIRMQTAIYMPGSGRINIAGLSEASIAPLAERLAPYLQAVLAEAAQAG